MPTSAVIRVDDVGIAPRAFDAMPATLYTAVGARLTVTDGLDALFAWSPFTIQTFVLSAAGTLARAAPLQDDANRLCRGLYPSALIPRSRAVTARHDVGVPPIGQQDVVEFFGALAASCGANEKHGALIWSALCACVNTSPHVTLAHLSTVRDDALALPRDALVAIRLVCRVAHFLCDVGARVSVGAMATLGCAGTPFVNSFLTVVDDEVVAARVAAVAAMTPAFLATLHPTAIGRLCGGVSCPGPSDAYGSTLRLLQPPVSVSPAFLAAAVTRVLCPCWHTSAPAMGADVDMSVGGPGLAAARALARIGARVPIVNMDVAPGSLATWVTGVRTLLPKLRLESTVGVLSSGVFTLRPHGDPGSDVRAFVEAFTPKPGHVSDAIAPQQGVFLHGHVQLRAFHACVGPLVGDARPDVGLTSLLDVLYSSGPFVAIVPELDRWTLTEFGRLCAALETHAYAPHSAPRRLMGCVFLHTRGRLPRVVRAGANATPVPASVLLRTPARIQWAGLAPVKAACPLLEGRPDEDIVPRRRAPTFNTPTGAVSATDFAFFAMRTPRDMTAWRTATPLPAVVSSDLISCHEDVRRFKRQRCGFEDEDEDDAPVTAIKAVGPDAGCGLIVDTIANLEDFVSSTVGLSTVVTVVGGGASALECIRRRVGALLTVAKQPMHTWGVTPSTGACRRLVATVDDIRRGGRPPLPSGKPFEAVLGVCSPVALEVVPEVLVIVIEEVDLEQVVHAASFVGPTTVCVLLVSDLAGAETCVRAIVAADVPRREKDGLVHSVTMAAGLAAYIGVQGTHATPACPRRAIHSL